MFLTSGAFELSTPGSATFLRFFVCHGWLVSQFSCLWVMVRRVDAFVYLFGNLSSSSSCSVLFLFFFAGRHFWLTRLGRTVYTLRVVGTCCGVSVVVVILVVVVGIVVGRCLIVTTEGVLLAMVKGRVIFSVDALILVA